MSYNDNLFYGASPLIMQRAKELRNRTTKAEELLWNCLRNKKLGFKFRRQHPISRFIADFYCHEKRLVIEIDGGNHDRPENKQYDENRTAELDRFGIKVIRFKNRDVECFLADTVKNIKRELEHRKI